MQEDPPVAQHLSPPHDSDQPDDAGGGPKNPPLALVVLRSHLT